MHKPIFTAGSVQLCSPRVRSHFPKCDPAPRLPNCMAREPIDMLIEAVTPELPDTKTLRLKWPDGHSAEFKTGQFITLFWPDTPGYKRAYSLSSCALDRGFTKSRSNAKGRWARASWIGPRIEFGVTRLHHIRVTFQASTTSGCLARPSWEWQIRKSGKFAGTNLPTTFIGDTF